MTDLRHRAVWEIIAAGASVRAAVALAAMLLAAAALAACPPLARASAAPEVGSSWTTDVTAASATFHAEVNPEGLPTTYHFEYITEAAFQANVNAGHEEFAGAARVPAGEEAKLGSASAAQLASQHVSALRPATTYHYRISATNVDSGGGTSVGSPRTFATQELSGAFALPDDRGWELVSPVEKNGGAIQGPGVNHGGDVLQAAVGGGEITYSSSSSFGEEAQGSPPASQYISRRVEEVGWSTENITSPTVSASYGNNPNGVPYQLFSPDLARSLILNGNHCRGEGSGCPVANPPLPGTEAPPGYQDYYLRDNEDDSFTALLTEANSRELALSAAQFNLAFAGASPDLRHILLSTCAKLTSGATEVAGVGGACNPAETNLYEWSEGQLKLINLLPGSETHGTPGASLAAQSDAVSVDGSRIYFTDGGKLYLREGSQTKEVAIAAAFQTANSDGSVAFFTTEEHPNEEHLYRYDAATATSESIATKVKGVLGASEDGSYLYYATATGVFLFHEGTTAEIASGAVDSSDYPPTTGTARVTPDGTRLAFLSAASLTGYDNADANTGLPDDEVYLYEAGAEELTCVSCNPTGERPLGPSTIPGAISNGKDPGATDAYKPRALVADGRRLFFDSEDALVPLDTDKAPDVYEWEAESEGSCRRAGGCLGLISSGSSGEGATFIDASADGSDVFFLTGQSLVPADPGSIDLYDARVEGGFLAPEPEIECEGDACQPLPKEPEDPTVGTRIPALGNPPLQYPKVHHTKPHHKHKAKKRHHKRRAANRKRGRR